MEKKNTGGLFSHFYEACDDDDEDEEQSEVI